MKKIIFSFLLAFVFAFNVESCPYQKMAEVDSMLYSKTTQINTKTFAQISNLRNQGEKKLQMGELDNAEQIFDKALALFKNQ